MKKKKLSQLWLYRYRFVLGYTLLGLIFATALFTLPFITPGGLSEAEMESSVTSYNTSFASIASGDLVDLPYHILQKLSISILGLSAFSIKLPSILIGLTLGFLLILLLNRWFKSNVALLASVISVFSAPFFFLAGYGTPLIMLVFWPTLLLWLGAKIGGKNKTHPIFSFLFVFALLLSIFTPHLIYLVAFIIIFALLNPHLRFTIKKLPKIPAITCAIIVIGGFTLFLLALFSNQTALATIFLAPDFSLETYWHNLSTAFAPFFAWTGNADSIFLAPLIGIATTALALVGLLSTAKGFFASRNAIASCFIIFAVILAGFDPSAAILLILPLAILIAHGLRYILEKWYDLFPENPYARIFAILPVTIFLCIVIVSDFTHFISGYRYNPTTANYFTTDLELVKSNLTPETTLVLAPDTLESDFYNILAHQQTLTTSDSFESVTTPVIATLGKPEQPPVASLTEIITSPKSDNSDRIYVYTINSAASEAPAGE